MFRIEIGCRRLIRSSVRLEQRAKERFVSSRNSETSEPASSRASSTFCVYSASTVMSSEVSMWRFVMSEIFSMIARTALGYGLPPR